MVSFIAPDAKERLEELRAQLSENSESLIQLFKTRSALAREIGQLKSELGLPARIREREEEIINSIPDLDNFSRAIISALFEYSIINENSSAHQSDPLLEGSNEIRISGSITHLEFLAGLLVSRPGVEVYTTGSLPESISRGLQMNGAHIINGEHDRPDITICLQKDGSECDIFISRNDEMYLKLYLPVPFSPSVVRVNHQ